MKKKILIAVLVIPLFLSAVLCCCLEGFAAPAPASSVEHCHAHADQAAGPQSHSQKSDDCPCPKRISLSSRSYDFESAAGALRSGEYLFAAVTLLMDISQDRVLQKRISHSPPRQASDVPIYLRDSVLRI